ncbi:hypothetical protein P280DRAFT_510697 [Massarina eburnea CBS 473.64]|uniref:Asl1-like glycosyl hydrolase catalytic domain-containing protein n=1 Tax=Massarina eburnea CBS 473.64 TaxID=1395130 RepID=A0A6A6RNU9_9PLEO|nr:hypothetical protein P280DRAFT_510697 [Massarina eburnea CBS 473.64]
MLTATLLFALAGLSSFTDAAPMEKRANAKRGLAFGKNAQSKADLFDSASWGYDWEARVTDAGAYTLSKREFVPMLHDGGAMFTAVFNTDAEAAIKAGAKNVLSINEPDQCGSGLGGACMSLQATIDTHKKYVQPLATKYPNVRIGSPAITNSDGASSGINFLKSFLSGCSDCRIDFVATHWYNGGDIEAFKKYLTNVHNQAKKNVWLTEFAAPDAVADKAKFMKDAMTWMDGQAWIERYAYMSVDSTLTQGSVLSALGKAYA